MVLFRQTEIFWVFGTPTSTAKCFGLRKLSFLNCSGCFGGCSGYLGCFGGCGGGISCCGAYGGGWGGACCLIV